MPADHDLKVLFISRAAALNAAVSIARRKLSVSLTVANKIAGVQAVRVRGEIKGYRAWYFDASAGQNVCITEGHYAQAR